MNENSVSFVNDKSLEVWDFIEGGKNNEFNEYHLTDQSKCEENYKFQDNLSGKIMKIKKEKEKNLLDIIKKNYKKEKELYNFKFFQNGKIYTKETNLEKLKKENVIQIFFLKKPLKEEEKIKEVKKENVISGSFSSSFSSEDDYYENKAENETEEILNFEENNFFLGFYYFENFLSVI